VPLSKIQIDVLRLLAAHRDPESYVAGATPLNRDAPRYSSDIDVFHDRQERVASAALSDAQALAAAGYAVRWLRQLPLMYTAEVTREGASTRLEWVADSRLPLFPNDAGRAVWLCAAPGRLGHEQGDDRRRAARAARHR